MRTKEILATVAITGAVATFALLNVGSIQPNKSFLATTFTESEREFINFIANYHRSYGTKEEYEFRLQEFTKKYNFIQEHNAEPHGYKLGINHLSDLTEYEYSQMLGYRSDLKKTRNERELESVAALPTSVDWRSSGAVNTVQNQGQCGSCWAFSAVASMEGAWYLSKGSLLKLSEQQLVDCAGLKYGNLGCNGGLSDNAFKYAESNKMDLESDYPYTAKDGTCASGSHTGKVQISKFYDVPAKSQNSLMTAIAQQPTSVAIQADQAIFQLYSSGVFDNANCGTSLDHAVVAVGYGYEGSQGYYIVRNSWGVTWGEKGYIRIAMTGDGAGICGIQMEANYPIV